jgi:hypothetical protein
MRLLTKKIINHAFLSHTPHPFGFQKIKKMADKTGRNLEQDHVTSNVSHAAYYTNKRNVARKWRQNNVESRKGQG